MTGASPRLYLAGPEVFLPDAREVGEAKKRICAAHGLVGLFPLDADPEEGATAERIYGLCLAMMCEADAILANLTPFRGIGADAGTAFELGFMAAAGKPLFGYSNTPDTLLDRTRAAGGTVERGGRTVMADGSAVEAFGLFDNLMLAEALRLGGGVVLPDRAVDDPARDLAAFTRCVTQAASRLGALTKS